jgi:hypothetical protein
VPLIEYATVLRSMPDTVAFADQYRSSDQMTEGPDTDILGDAESLPLLSTSRAAATNATSLPQDVMKAVTNNNGNNLKDENITGSLSARVIYIYIDQYLIQVYHLAYLIVPYNNNRLAS